MSTRRYGPQIQVYALDGQDHPEACIVVTYTSWGEKSLWEIQSSPDDSPSVVFQQVVNENGALSVWLEDIDGNEITTDPECNSTLLDSAAGCCSQCDTVTSELMPSEEYGWLCSVCSSRQAEHDEYGHGLSASTFGFLSESE